MIDILLSTVAPHLCTGCAKPGNLLCDDCKYDITSEPFAGCVVCAGPSTVGVCPRHGLAYQKAWCVGERQDVLQRLIGGFKFQNMRTGARQLAELLDSRLPSLPADTIIVPVPTIAAHIRERGYDHLALIVRRLAKRRGLTVSRIVGRRGRAVQHQADRRQRLQQAAEAFYLQGPIDPARPYLIVDDVITTGATVASIALLLQNAGAQHIWVAAVARQPLD